MITDPEASPHPNSLPAIPGEGTRRLRLLVTDLEIGGTPRVVKELAIRLRPLGFGAAVGCLAPWGPVANELRAAGVPVTAFDAMSARDLPRVVGSVRDWAEGADILLSFLMHANVFAALAVRPGGPRLIQSIQTTQPRPRWHWWLQGWAGRRAERIVVPSASVVDAAATWSGLPAERFVVIPNAIEMTKTIRPPRPDGPWRVGFVGRLDPVKRVPDLVAAVARIEDATLDIFGDGVERPTIEGAVVRHGIAGRATFHGTIASSADAWPLIDVLVLPSDAEGFGLVLIEAMAAGVPVVATDVPGIRDVVRHGVNGLLVPPRDPPALAAAIGRVREDGSLREALVRAGRDAVRSTYSWDRVLPLYAEALQ